MEWTLPQVFVYGAAWLGAVTGVYTLFEKAEEVVTDETKEGISSWLDSTRASPPTMTLLFGSVGMFDAVFGTHWWSWRFFRRSCLASGVSFALTMALFTVRGGLAEFDEPAPTAIFYCSVAALPNLLVDYISLLETRFVLGLMSRARSSSAIALFVVFDVIATFVLVTLGFLLLWLVMSLKTGDRIDEAIAVVYDYSREKSFLRHFFFGDGVFLRGKGGLTGVVVYSSYFTSVWIWLYLLSMLANRGIALLLQRFAWFLRWFDVRKKPIRTLGFMAVLIVSVAFAIPPVMGMISPSSVSKTAQVDSLNSD